MAQRVNKGTERYDKNNLLFTEYLQKYFLPFEQEPIDLERSAILNLGPDRGDIDKGDKGCGDKVDGGDGVTGVREGGYGVKK